MAEPTISAERLLECAYDCMLPVVEWHDEFTSWGVGSDGWLLFMGVDGKWRRSDMGRASREVARALLVALSSAAERADSLERELRGKDSAIATAEALVMAHEGRIDSLAARVAELEGLLERARGRLVAITNEGLRMESRAHAQVLIADIACALEGKP